MNKKKSLLTTTLSTIALVVSSHPATAAEDAKKVSEKPRKSGDERDFAVLSNKHENVNLLHSRIGNNGV